MNSTAFAGKRLLESGALALGMSLLAANATAQTPAQTQTTDRISVLEEIVVTARFREENMQSVGQSISALSGSQIEASGYTDFADVVRHTPGLNATYRGPNSSTPSIRGLATLSPILDTLTTPQLIGIYYDDIPITAPFASQRDVSFVDLKRIEVLRGPQGTLYGEGAMGGAIRYVSADPDMQQVSGQVNMTGSAIESGDVGHNVDVSVGTPVIADRLAVRASAWDRDDKGFIDFTRAGVDDANSYKSRGGRAVVLANLTDELSVRLTALRDEGEIGGDWTVTGDPERLRNDLRLFSSETQDDVDLVGLRIAYEAPFGTFQTTTGYYERTFDRVGFDAPVAGLFAFLPDADPTLNLTNEERAVTNETRFVSSFDGPFNFVIGGFYKDRDYTTTQFEIMPAGLPVFGTVNLLDIEAQHDEKQYAAFAEGYYQPSQRLKFTLGLRYFENEVLDALQTGLPGVFFPAPFTFDNETKLSALLPKFAVEGWLTDSVLLYGSVSTGARTGGVNSPISVADLPAAQQAAARTYDDDSVVTYEVGLKSTLRDGRLIANVAAYYNDWRDAQVTLLTPTTAFSYFANAGKVHIKGLEAELQAKLGGGLSMYAAAAYADAQTAEDLTIGGPTNRILPAGSRVPFVPEYNAAVGMDWLVNLSADLTLDNKLEYVWTDESVTALGGTARTDSLGQLNLRLTFGYRSFSATAFASNLTNEIRATAIEGQQEMYINRPRTVGLTLRYDF